MASSPIRFRHFNGTATDSVPAKISVKRGQGQRLVIQNVSAIGGATLQFSVDGGKTYFSIPPQTAETPFKPVVLDALFHYVTVQGSGGDADYEILLGEK